MGTRRKPSGIPSALVYDQGASVSTGFPAPDAGWGPAASAKYAPGRTPPAIFYGTGHRRSEMKKESRVGNEEQWPV